MIKQKPSVLGMLSGAIAGIIAITPGGLFVSIYSHEIIFLACGWVDQTGAFFIGTLAGPWCYLGAQLKHWAGYDDALDAFGVHATGGILGGLLTGFFAQPAVFGPFTAPSPTRYAGVFYAIGSPDQFSQLGIQAYGVTVTILYSCGASFVLFKLIDVTIGLKSKESSLDVEMATQEQENSIKSADVRSDAI